MKIITFTFAGGSKYSFPNFSKNLSNFVVLEYPGRGIRTDENFITDIDLLIEDLLPKVKNEINSSNDYIIYGHSMGALIGYLVCHKIKELKIKQPLKLIVSGRKAPSIKKEEILSDLPDSEFWEEIIKIGGIADEIQNYNELMEFYIPILKADFKTTENYIYTQKGKLNLDIDVFYGNDEDITEEEIIGWKNESTETVTINVLNGNHFFMFDHESFFIEYFNKSLI